mmetsp:Transcript_40500/g.61769  ORF Transcript_40500/g.61769 Transcript_40500/m.61769 type:complete len:86 (-) Transcript_40500:346-603(-)
MEVLSGFPPISFLSLRQLVLGAAEVLIDRDCLGVRRHMMKAAAHIMGNGPLLQVIDTYVDVVYEITGAASADLVLVVLLLVHLHL